MPPHAQVSENLVPSWHPFIISGNEPSLITCIFDFFFNYLQIQHLPPNIFTIRPFDYVSYVFYFNSIKILWEDLPKFNDNYCINNNPSFSMVKKKKSKKSNNRVVSFYRAETNTYEIKFSVPGDVSFIWIFFCHKTRCTDI